MIGPLNQGLEEAAALGEGFASEVLIIEVQEIEAPER